MAKRTLNKILIIDDDHDILTIVSIILESDGLTVLCCDSGEKAVALAISFKPDLIMLDVMMPGMDGSATLQALKTHPGTKDMPIVFLTAKSQKEELEHFKQLGAIDVMMKPFLSTSLCQDLQKIWKRYEES